MPINVEEKNGELIISMPFEKARPSKSGKTHIVASSRGPVYTDVVVGDKHVVVVATAYVHPHGEEWQQRARASRDRTAGRLR